MLARLTTAIVRRPGRFTVLFAVIVLSAASIGGNAPKLLADAPGDDFADPSAETWTTRAALEAEADDAGVQVLAVVELQERWPSAAATRQITDLQEQIADEPGVAAVRGPAVPDEAPQQDRDTAEAAFVSEDGTLALLAASTETDADRIEVALALRERFSGDETVRLGGPALIEESINAQVETDLGRAEMFAFPLLFIVSIWVFGSVVGALMPLMTGIATIMLTFFALVVFDSVEPMSVFAINLVFAIGLGLAVDYSLLLVTRVREARAAGHGQRSAVRVATISTSSTIIFSALTVAAAMAALTLFPQRFLWSMGVGGILCALLAAVASLTLLPAVLALLGDRVDALSPRRAIRRGEHQAAASQTGPWATLVRLVMRRPGTVAAVTAIALLLLASPMLRVAFTGVDASVLPDSSVPRAVAEQVEADFPMVGATRIQVVARSTPEQLQDAVAAALDAGGRDADAVGKPGTAERTGSLSVVELPLRVGPNDDRAIALVDTLRREVDERVDMVGVTGDTTVTVDTLDSFGDVLPWAALLTASTTMVLVFLFTGSLLLPIKAVIMNTLGVAAALGILVLVFQDGRFENLIGYTSQGALESSQPILIVAIAFGLSTDYGIILLGRIREERMRGLSDVDAVAAGIQRTGGLITSAALLLSIALGAFVTSQIVFIQQIGVGTVAAVLIDATIIRALLVPSLMAMLGRWNWWAPAPLRRLHDRIGVRESHGIDAPTADDLALDDVVEAARIETVEEPVEDCVDKPVVAQL